MLNWLNRDSVNGELGSRAKYSAYRTYVEQGNDEVISRLYQLKTTPPILGDKLLKEYAYGLSESLRIEIDKKGCW